MPPYRVIAAVLVLAATACGADERPEKEASTTPEAAFISTRDVVADLLDALQPGSSSTIGEPDRKVPCGGVAGNELTRIKAAVTGTIDQGPTDLDAARDRVTDVVERAGWKATVRPLEDQLQVAISGDAGRGLVTLAADGTGRVGAETICLPDPDR